MAIRLPNGLYRVDYKGIIAIDSTMAGAWMQVMVELEWRGRYHG